MMRWSLVVLALLGACAAQPKPAAELAPRIEHVQSEGATIDAHVFDAGGRGRRAAIVLLHGGGWVAGDATWVYPRARRFANEGLLAVAVDYRLSDQQTVTPLDAMADARAVIRWIRANATALRVDPDRIAAYGVSAGGHLAVSAAQSDDAASRPNLLVLTSPALDLARDNWFVRLLGTHGDAAAIAPLNNVRAGLPPTLIQQGDVDTLTPLVAARTFCERMTEARNSCELKIYPGYGHLFTPAGINDQEMPQPDPTISAQAADEADAFLRRQGYIR